VEGRFSGGFRDFRPALCDGLAVIKELLSHEQSFGMGSEDALIAVTSAYIGRKSGDENPDFEDFDLGIWRNRATPSIDRRIALFSTAPWIDRYERAGYRSVGQYLSFLTVAFLGDHLVDGGLTHLNFRRCVFDYNGDNASVVESVKQSRLCDECRDRLKEMKTIGGFDSGQVASAFTRLLKLSRYPTARHVWRSFQEDPLISVFGTGFVISLLTGLIIEHVKNDTVVFLAGLLLLFFLRRFYPSGKLG
jgi:hypothetical protein